MNNDLNGELKDARTIFFVCSGNIIRSSFAELYAKHLGISNTSSYGTTYHNSKIHSKSESKLREIGIDPSLLDNFSPTHIEDVNDIDEKDIHIVMTSKHKKQLLKKGISPNRIIKITELIGENRDVADPYFEGNYEEAYSTIMDAVSQINNLIT